MFNDNLCIVKFCYPKSRQLFLTAAGLFSAGEALFVKFHKFGKMPFSCTYVIYFVFNIFKFSRVCKSFLCGTVCSKCSSSSSQKSGKQLFSKSSLLFITPHPVKLLCSFFLLILRDKCVNHIH